MTRKVAFAVEGPTAPATDPWGNTRIGASAHAKINRRDWGLHWNAALEAGGVVVGEQVKISIEVELVQAAVAAKLPERDAATTSARV